MTRSLLEVEDLTVKYRTESDDVVAASNVSFNIKEGEFLGLAGESGCGKTTLAKAIFHGLDNNGYISSGKVRYRGEEIQDYSENKINNEIRWKEIAWIPQGSMTSIDPLMKVKQQALQIGRVHSDLSDEEIFRRFNKMVEVVGLSSDVVKSYPHQLSGGMHQRVVIALSLFLEPSIIIADEPTTALDVIMQDRVLNYFDKIRDDRATSLMLITHDISLIFETCDNMAIMHAGQLCERGSVVDLYDSPSHPYSILLQDAFPSLEHQGDELVNINGYPPKVTEEADYCSFKDRCPLAVEECSKKAPPEERINNQGGEDTKHMVSCLRRDETQQLRESTDTQETKQ